MFAALTPRFRFRKKFIFSSASLGLALSLSRQSTSQSFFAPRAPPNSRWRTDVELPVVAAAEDAIIKSKARQVEDELRNQVTCIHTPHIKILHIAYRSRWDASEFDENLGISLYAHPTGPSHANPCIPDTCEFAREPSYISTRFQGF